MKRYIKSSYNKQNGPKGYVYQLCDILGWRYPTFIDSAAGGYAIKFDSSIKNRALDSMLPPVRGEDIGERLDRRNRAWDMFNELTENEQTQLLKEAEAQLIAENNRDLDKLKNAAYTLGISLIRSYVKRYGRDIRFYAVVPRKN